MTVQATDYPIRAEVRVALCETNATLRTAFRAALHRRGLRNLEVCRDSAQLLELLDQRLIDLVVCSSDLPGLDFAELMQCIRRRDQGRNPFTMILATVADRSLDEIRRVINAGVDRVAAKPLSMSDMLNHINALATSRKPFVATPGYVGPSRRAAVRPEQRDQDVLVVPNTLRAKIRDRLSDGELEKLIDAGMAGVERLRTHNTCVAISRSVRRLAEHFQAEGSFLKAGLEISRLIGMTDALEQHYRGGDNDHFSDVASSLALLVGLLVRLDVYSPQASLVTLELMLRLADVISQIGQSDPESVLLVREIAQTVRGFVTSVG
jgi:DNA-binding response OmpR family regulator